MLFASALTSPVFSVSSAFNRINWCICFHFYLWRTDTHIETNLGAVWVIPEIIRLFSALGSLFENVDRKCNHFWIVFRRDSKMNVIELKCFGFQGRALYGNVFYANRLLLATNFCSLQFIVKKGLFYVYTFLTTRANYVGSRQERPPVKLYRERKEHTKNGYCLRHYSSTSPPSQNKTDF